MKKPPLRRILWKCLVWFFPGFAIRRSVKRTYNTIAEQAPQRDLAFLNEGYAPLDPDEPVPVLADEDKPFQFQINLYHHVARHVDLHGKDVLEVGSGRGGGSDYVMRHLEPASVIGLDLSDVNVALATRAFGRNGLSFRQGDAEALPLPPDSFDVVVSVESSHLYPHPERFFREAHRVLRPGGHFLFVDLGDRGRMQGLADQFRGAGFEVLAARDITRNVIESIRKDNDRRRRILSSIAKDEEDFGELAAWARIVGTPGYHAYCDGRDQYWSYVLRKPRGVGSP